MVNGENRCPREADRGALFLRVPYTGNMTEENRIEDERRRVELKWSSPARLFKKRDKEYFRNIGAIVFFLLVILVFAREFVLVAAVLSIVFLLYVLSTVPPDSVEHKITDYGIESAGHFYRWEELSDFWFERQWDQEMVVIRPILGSLIIVLLGKMDRDTLKTEMEKRIAYKETPQKSWVDNAADWLGKKIPLEKPE